MNYADEAINAAIREVQRLRDQVRKRRSNQVRGSERDIIRATSLSWFNSHRKQLTSVLEDGDLSEIDELYRQVLNSTHKNALRSGYLSTFKKINDSLIQLRSGKVIVLSAAPPPLPPTNTSDRPPDFSLLVKDQQMKAILGRRWLECAACLAAEAPLAATVMMGGLLEGLLLARVNSESNKAPIFTAGMRPERQAAKNTAFEGVDSSKLHRGCARTEVDLPSRQRYW
jgi:hypothetical protein